MFYLNEIVGIAENPPKVLAFASEGFSPFFYQKSSNFEYIKNFPAADFSSALIISFAIILAVIVLKRKLTKVVEDKKNFNLGG